MAEAKVRISGNRIELAEQICLLYGWTAVHHDSDRDKALYLLWNAWCKTVPKSFTKPKNHPELSDEQCAKLAAIYDANHERTMKAIEEMLVPVKET
jgi:hypothetical protein